MIKESIGFENGSLKSNVTAVSQKGEKGPWRALLSLVAVVLSLSVGGAKAWAITSPETTTVGVVEYLPGSLLIQDAAGNNFGALLSSPAGCTANNQTIDTLKMWQSMGQAALLAAKTVKIYFNVCGGNNFLAGFDIDK
jgi:hypothetical protein